MTHSGYPYTVTGPLGPPLEQEAIYPSLLIEASRAGRWAAQVAQLARAEGWTVQQTRDYVTALRAGATAAGLEGLAPAVCEVCHRTIPAGFDGRRALRQFCSNAHRQKAYRRRHAAGPA